MIKFLLRLSMASAAILALSVAPAFAYNETSILGRSCADCHGLESSAQDTSTVAPGRQGPHGGYSSGTEKCDTCHVIHGAASNSALLAEATIEATCQTCHDGTGGGGVYGPTPPTNGHRVGEASLNGSGTVTVPGGDPSATFTGTNGALTCTDCHSPHNSDTVNPFVGDRKRSSGETSTDLATNRLLRRKTTLGTVAVNEYGSNWCESCHSTAHPAGSSHPVSRDASGTFYGNVIVRAGLNTTAAAPAATDLGGSNFGYVLPTEPTGTVRPAPICQQCHEDARSVGQVASFSIVASEAFVANTNGTGNPAFQNFPHETQGANLLIEQNSDLCENCHTP